MLTDSLAPIALFVYNRKVHTEQLVESLKRNELAKESDLIIYSDYAKKEEDKENVEEVRKYLKTIEGFKTVKIVERTSNWGLSRSIIDGVSQTIQEYGKIIVLEDDLVVSSHFLDYMNRALEEYKEKKNVFSICGNSYFETDKTEYPQTYFLSLSSSWSWATWKNRWEKFDAEADGWEQIKKNKKLRYEFDYNGSYPFSEMIIAQMESHTIDSWAIRWYWTIFKKNGLCLFPRVALCENNGFDGSGVHCSDLQQTTVIECVGEKIEYYETNIVEQSAIRHELVKHFKKQQKISLFTKIERLVRKIISRVK